MTPFQRTLLAFVRHPGIWIEQKMHHIFEKHYAGKHPKARWMFALDFVVVGMLIGGIIAIGVFAYILHSPISQLDFTVAVAPTPIRSGAPSTLVFRWQNTSEEPLQNAVLNPVFPEHFLVQEISSAEIALGENLIDLGTIPPQGSGSLKVRGVMFGDVGGTQTFAGTLAFRAGKYNRRFEKRLEQTFVPQESALSIVSDIPETIIGGQEVDTAITVSNDGLVDFGAVSILTERTDLSFRILKGDAKETKQGESIRWTIPSLTAGSKKTIVLRGIAPPVSSEQKETWSFAATFVFDQIEYHQGTSEKTFTLFPSPLRLEMTPDTLAITPGGFASVALRLTNVSDRPIPLAGIFVEGTSVFLAPRSGKNANYRSKQQDWSVTNVLRASLNPEEELTVRAALPILSSISAAGLSAYTEFRASLRGAVEFSLPETQERVRLHTEALSIPITSPLSLRSAGYYFTPQSDQIGRGPLPPRVGEETRYWVFWNLEGTTNTLKDVQVRGTLPANVRFTGKHTQMSGGRLEQDGNELVWTIAELMPTFGPNGKTTTMGFELGITPTEKQKNTAATILEGSTALGTDAFTNAIVQAYGARITTHLTEDPLAENFGIIE